MNTPEFLPPKSPRPSEAPLIKFAYQGVRTSYFVYHPKYHGVSYSPEAWGGSLDRFNKMVKSFCDVALLYTDIQTMSESVGGDRWKKELDKLVAAVDRDGKDVYELEALATSIFDVDDKTSQRPLPYHKDLKDAASELRAMDLGMKNKKTLTAKDIIRHTWTG